MNGLQIISNFHGCQFDFSKETEVMDIVAQYCIDAGLTVVGKSFFHFDPQGVTFTILLAESHVSFHSWPEERSVAFDIYTCNQRACNNEKTQQVYERVKTLLSPIREQTQFIERDSLKSSTVDLSEKIQ